MRERDEILRMLEKHKDYFENVPRVDVAFSTKGDCFFYEYDDVHQEYIIFKKFRSAEELENLIEENIATDFCVNIQQLVESVLCSLDDTFDHEVEETGLSTMDRRILMKTFVAFSKALEEVY